MEQLSAVMDSAVRVEEGRVDSLTNNQSKRTKRKSSFQQIHSKIVQKPYHTMTLMTIILIATMELITMILHSTNNARSNFLTINETNQI